MPRTADYTREHESAGATRLPGEGTASHQSDRFARPEIRSRHVEIDEEPAGWQRVGIFSAGLAVGLVVGAGAALLFAPQSGEDTRELIGEQARSVTGRVADRWDDLRDELRAAARRSRRRVRRSVTRGRWAAEDVVERGRRRR